MDRTGGQRKNLGEDYDDVLRPANAMFSTAGKGGDGARL